MSNIKGKVEFSRHKVFVIESESGWGSKVDGTLYFDTKENAMLYVKEFNSHNTSTTVPSWYMYAEYIGD